MNTVEIIEKFVVYMKLLLNIIEKDNIVLHIPRYCGMSGHAYIFQCQVSSGCCIPKNYYKKVSYCKQIVC